MDIIVIHCEDLNQISYLNSELIFVCMKYILWFRFQSYENEKGDVRIAYDNKLPPLIYGTFDHIGTRTFLLQAKMLPLFSVT